MRSKKEDELCFLIISRRRSGTRSMFNLTVVRSFENRLRVKRQGDLCPHQSIARSLSLCCLFIIIENNRHRRRRRQQLVLNLASTRLPMTTCELSIFVVFFNRIIETENEVTRNYVYARERERRKTEVDFRNQYTTSNREGQKYERRGNTCRARR